MTTTTTPTTDVTDELRAWAKGSYPAEAAVELLTRAFGGRFARPGRAWIACDRGRWWLDAAQLVPTRIGALSGGEQRLLLIVGSLAGGHPVDLGDVAGLDRALLDLVLAAVAHAAGSHEHAIIQQHSDGTASFARTSTLHPWPALGGGSS